MVSYRVMLDVPKDLIWFVSRLLAARRREIGTRKGTRRLGCYKQALFALAWFRDKGDIARLGRGFELAQSTAYRPILGTKAQVTRPRPGEEARRGRGTRHCYPGQERADPLGALPGASAVSRC